MTRSMVWTGFFATMAILVVLGIYTAFEPSRQAHAQARLEAEAIQEATDLYAENCAICHGAEGEGIGATPGLANDGVQGMSYETLTNVIARGRYGTAMPGWSVDEGGVLMPSEVEALTILLQNGNWQSVGQRVSELGLAPPTAVVVEVPEALLVEIAQMEGGDVLSQGITFYAENCAACHGANLDGTSLAPSLTRPELLAKTDDEILRTIREGVPSTLMAGWGGKIADDDATALLELIRRWNDMQSSGIELPTIEVPVVEATPEMIAEGQHLFSITCVACHGTDALGTRMAPALNNQTFLSQTPDAAIAQIIAGGVPGTLMPAWGGRLTESDINALVAYLRSLEDTAPVIVPVPTGQAPAGGGGPPWRNNP